MQSNDTILSVNQQDFKQFAESVADMQTVQIIVLWKVHNVLQLPVRFVLYTILQSCLYIMYSVHHQKKTQGAAKDILRYIWEISPDITVYNLHTMQYPES